MKNPIEGKPENLNQHQGLGILAIKYVNTLGVDLSEIVPRQKNDRSRFDERFRQRE